MQVLLNMTEYLSPDRYGKWLKVEGNGEEAKFWCWVCHQYTGAKALQGVLQVREAQEEPRGACPKQIIGAKAFKLHGVHGIRWVASIRSVLAKVYRMLHLIVIDLSR